MEPTFKLFINRIVASVALGCFAESFAVAAFAWCLLYCIENSGA